MSNKTNVINYTLLSNDSNSELAAMVCKMNEDWWMPLGAAFALVVDGKPMFYQTLVQYDRRESA